ncbi:MAG: outer membrane lipoprotein-sorting protein [Opitutales bacterium]|nr:outer membrane lipoprotein-sorting protein [Opitutales bacterium]MCH8539163.1 outer membrane lipoprotein-sorting protein [Opitutales bacterium]
MKVKHSMMQILKRDETKIRKGVLFRVSSRKLFPSLLLMVLGLSVLIPCALDAQPRTRPTAPESRFDDLEKEEAEAFLERFRENTLQASYVFGFEMRVMPARGKGVTYQGRLWNGPVSEDTAGSLVEIFSDDRTSPEVQLLFHRNRSGESRGWKYSGSVETQSPEEWGEEKREGVQVLEYDQFYQPLLETDYSPFDLQMPFVFWQDASYEGRYFLRGRSTYTFLVHPPEKFQEDDAWPWKAIRLHFDAEFEALMQVDWIDSRNRDRRTLALLEIKEVEDQWIPKTLDFRNRETRGKTRFTVNQVAFNLAFPQEIFTPMVLGRWSPVLDDDFFHPVQ